MASTLTRWGVRSDRRGSVSIEIAIVVPVLLMAAVGLVDLVRYLDVTIRLDRVASSVAGMVTRSTVLLDRSDFASVHDSKEIGMFLLAGNKLAEPDDLAAHGRVVLTSLTIGSGIAVNWQRSGPYGIAATSRAQRLAPLPPAGEYVLAEVFYQFKPLILDRLGILPGVRTLIYRQAMFRPRLNTLTSLGQAG